MLFISGFLNANKIHKMLPVKKQQKPINLISIEGAVTKNEPVTEKYKAIKSIEKSFFKFHLYLFYN